MIKNYLLVAYRNLVRYKIYSIINITGLAIGIAFCILTFLYVRQEWAYDTFHENADRMYRVYMHEKDRQKKKALLPSPLGPALSETFSENIEHTTRIFFTSQNLITPENSARQKVCLVDPQFLNIFTFPLISGNPNTALIQKDAIVITEKMAQKYFGSQDPIGQSISFSRSDQNAWVTGVLKNIPETSSIQFDALRPYENIDKSHLNWNTANNTSTYVLLNKHTHPSNLEALFPDAVKRWWPEKTDNTLALQPLLDIHLNPDISGPEPIGDRTYVHTLLTLTLLVLFVACVNFMTMALGRSPSRAREVGIRKVVGAKKTQVINQFLGESLLLSTVAFVIGIVLAELFMPLFNDLFDQKLSLFKHTDSTALISLTGIALSIGILSGSYPAFVMSGFMPIQILKGKLKIGNRNLFSQILVIFQVGMSASLIICALFITWQINYLKTKPLGFDSEQLIVVNNLRYLKRAAPTALETYRTNLLSHHAITHTTGMQHTLNNRFGSWGPIQHEGQLIQAVEQFYGDHNYIPTLGLKLLEGRNFDTALTTDPETTIIINETLAKQLGGETALGKTVQMFNQSRTVIGIVNDFHFRSLHTAVGPALLRYLPEYPYNSLIVRISPQNISQTLAFMENQWQDLTQNRRFRYAFLDEEIDRQYRKEERLQRMINYGTLFAIFIACLGAFGLTALAVSRRTKEIGIRKVLGATIPNIVTLLSREFILLIALANLIAWPVAYWAMTHWLANFAYRIDLGIGTFILGGLLTLLVVITTVSLQALKAAKMNPVDTLRYE